ncbi:TetR family transcriptional regulator [Actinoplanes sp. SE50]|uniref:TetR/AcrR family transcriptional regulator n=1 Tax=unclassified Actinoplanes TaxID=2626549 RepID=UPI00023EE0CF|nr:MULTISPECIES: TetR/AcrR family transcriptional regulator [unclassified Actinoplanes]AEV89039.1 HTH-type transcriptional regulator tcmR [Actinoplanes sp. SE50/110]ATO87445.1 TetR family transcriptional regulator [Actinoplanes sp. SE50]SLM04863.1 TetR family transcriptional regulator [Actinoplanes sp. SE50/110]
MSDDGGLRERKKAATRQALHEASLRLAFEHGPDRITVEAIADEAGVSRRTFSNYFANKEEALFYGDLQRMRLLAGKVREQPAGTSPWEALSSAAEAFYGELGDLDPEWIARSRLVRRHPSLAATQVQTFAALEQGLADELAARLGAADPIGMRSRLIAATFLTVLRVSLNVWLERRPDLTFWDLARDAIADAGRGFA